MKKRKGYKHAYTAVKSHQHLVNKLDEKIVDWEIDYFFINDRKGVLSKRARNKIGHVQKKHK